MISKRKEFILGMRDTTPMIIGAIPFGIIFGTLASANGLSSFETMALSTFVFAGSAQFIALGLFAAGASWPVILLTTGVVNLRHLLYSATMVPHIKHLSQYWRALLSFGLTDESFVIVIQRYEVGDKSPLKHWYFLGSIASMYTNWQVCTWIGMSLGERVPMLSNLGLEFAMLVTFIAMVTPYLRTSPMWVSTMTAGISAVFSYPLPYKTGLLLSAIVGICAGVFVERFNERRKV